MTVLSHQDLLSRLVELFDYRVKEVSLVDEGANLMPFLLTKNLTRANVDKETFEALLKTEIQNSDKVIEVIKSCGIDAGEQKAFENSLKVITALQKKKRLSKKTLGDVFAAAELAEMTGTATDNHVEIRKAFEFLAEKVATKISKMIEVEIGPDQEDPARDEVPAEADPLDTAEQEMANSSVATNKGDMGQVFPTKDMGGGCATDTMKAKAPAMDGSDPGCADKVNKRRDTGMDLTNLPVTKEGDLDVLALKRSKVDDQTIHVVKGLWDQNKKLTQSLDVMNDRLNSEVELRVDKQYDLESAAFPHVKFEGLKDVLKKFGTTMPDEYPKFKALLTLCNDTLKSPETQDFAPMGGSQGGATSGSNPGAFYNVCKSKATGIFKDDAPVTALQKYWKTEEGRRDYERYNDMVTNRR